MSMDLVPPKDLEAIERYQEHVLQCHPILSPIQVLEIYN